MSSTAGAVSSRSAADKATPAPTTSYRTVSVDGLKVFYREAGDA